jgi:hypothetical protein
MDLLDREIMTAFGQGERPDEGELVSWDGFDVLDKEGAVRFFSEKTWADVLAHLRGLKDEPVFRGAHFHEEWCVLTPLALGYYARAYLEFLRETLAAAQPDEEFVFYFLGALYQVFHMHKGSPFSPMQTSLLRRVVERTGEQAAAGGSFEYFGDDIKLQAEQVLTEMEAHDPRERGP